MLKTHTPSARQPHVRRLSSCIPQSLVCQLGDHSSTKLSAANPFFRHSEYLGIMVKGTGVARPVRRISLACPARRALASHGRAALRLSVRSLRAIGLL